MNEPEQMSLEQLYECPTCHGTGLRMTNDKSSDSRVLAAEGCKTCFGSGNVTYDPNDHTVPY